MVLHLRGFATGAETVQPEVQGCCLTCCLSDFYSLVYVLLNFSLKNYCKCLLESTFDIQNFISSSPPHVSMARAL